MTISALSVEQNRHDTSKVVHYMGSSIKNAIRKARELSHTTTRDCAWIISGNTPIAKYFKGKRFKPSDTV